MEMIQLKRDCDAIAIPGGQHETLRQGTSVAVVQARGGSYTVSTDRHAMYRIDGADADALGFAKTETPEVQSTQGPLSEQLVLNALKSIFDPEIPVNIVDLGLIYSCEIADAASGGKSVAVRMALTSPGCGMSNVLKTDVESRLLHLPEVSGAHVDIVFDPPWSPARMSEAARLQLGVDLDDTPKLIQIGRSG